MWKAWGSLHETISTGEPAFVRVHGQSFFTYLADHPDDAEIFNAAMTAGSEMSIPAILKAYDFSSLGRIVDVGGGQGALLGGILSANSNVRGILFDFPTVVANATPLLKGELSSRCEVIGGDFFQSVPEGGDAYLLKGIVHDWNDENALTVLKNCRKAISSDGQLLLIESVLKASGEPDPGTFMDVLMLTLVGGRERTESNFRALLHEAGFNLMRVIQTEGPTILESRPC